MKNITITLTLPVSEENEWVISLIAMDNGWLPEEETAIQAGERLAQRDVGAWLENKIYAAHKQYYGENKAEERTAIIQQYKENVNITLTFE